MGTANAARAACLGVLVTAVPLAAGLALASPATAQAPSGAAKPAPSSAAKHLPIEVTLGGLHLTLDLPLTVPGLLGVGKSSSAPVATPTSTRPTAPATTHAAPGPTRPARHKTTRPRPHTTHPHAAHASVVAHPRPHGEQRSQAPRRAAKARPATTSPAQHREQISAFAPPLRPGTPVMVLVVIVAACGIGTAIVVRAGGHRGTGSGRHRP